MPASFSLILYLFMFWLAITLAITDPLLPVVVLHGIASSQANMQGLVDWLGREFSLKVYNLEIGNGEKTSLYSPLTVQLSQLCATIYGMPGLKAGFNFIGMSQGGVLARGYVERCNAYPVATLITLVAPHGGVYLPGEIGKNMYAPFTQAHLSLSGYWRDPFQLDRYFTQCKYLPLLNNENPLTARTNLSLQQYTNILSLKNLVLVWSPKDEVLKPAESGKFSFYDASLNIIALADTLLYQADLLGLKTLQKSGRLATAQTNCSHVQHRDPICFSQLYPIFQKYLRP